MKDTLPFGGLQIIFVGDFFQLPPVTKDGKEMKFAFESKAWEAAAPKVCYLTEQHRQSDRDRTGDVASEHQDRPQYEGDAHNEQSVVPQRAEPAERVAGHPVYPRESGHSQQDQLRPPQDRRDQGDDRGESDDGQGVRPGPCEGPGHKGQDHGRPRCAVDAGKAAGRTSGRRHRPAEHPGHPARRDSRQQPGTYRDEDEPDDQKSRAGRRPAGDHPDANTQDGSAQHPGPTAGKSFFGFFELGGRRLTGKADQHHRVGQFGPDQGIRKRQRRHKPL